MRPGSLGLLLIAVLVLGVASAGAIGVGNAQEGTADEESIAVLAAVANETIVDESFADSTVDIHVLYDDGTVSSWTVRFGDEDGEARPLVEQGAAGGAFEVQLEASTLRSIAEDDRPVDAFLSALEGGEIEVSGADPDETIESPVDTSPTDDELDEPEEVGESDEGVVDPESREETDTPAAESPGAEGTTLDRVLRSNRFWIAIVALALPLGLFLGIRRYRGDDHGTVPQPEADDGTDASASAEPVGEPGVAHPHRSRSSKRPSETGR